MTVLEIQHVRTAFLAVPILTLKTISAFDIIAS